MNISQERHLKKLNRAINGFAGEFMSNSKWLKLFRTLSNNHKTIKHCLAIDVYEGRERILEIPPDRLFNDVFHEKGIKDAFIGGPMLFKELQQLHFPAIWTVPRRMGSEMLQPFIYSQDLDAIEGLINRLGNIELERTTEKLIVYGYR